ncbi:MAG: hypothetical protein ACI9EF_002180 [Pseudohongiellaceae bacterium]|jgi:hypothetical protein
MQLDDLKDAWSAHGATLERSLAIDERLLREVLLRKVRIALTPHVLWRAFEVLVGIAALVLGLPVLAAHGAAHLYIVVVGGLAVFTVAMIAQSSYLLVKSLSLDYAKPVTTIQRDMEHLKIAEYRALKWAVLGGIVAWLPAALILFEAFTGVAALARVNFPWLAGNLAFGLLVLGCGQAASRKYVEHPDLSPRARRLMEALSGRALRSATAHLNELASFEQEP